MKKRFTLTTQNTNSYGFAVLAAGIDTSRFIENPVMLYNHDLNNIVGTWVDLKLENKTLTAIPQFDDDAVSQGYAKKVESGSLRGASVWIEPIEVKLGVEGFPSDLPVVTKSILMEASVTPVPSDATALQLCSSKREVLIGEKLQTILLSANNTNENNLEMKKITFFATALLPAGITLKADSTEDDLLGVTTKLAADFVAETVARKAAELKLSALEKEVNDGKEANSKKKVAEGFTSGKLKATATETKEQVEARWLKLFAIDSATAEATLASMTTHAPLHTQLTAEGTEVEAKEMKGKTFNELFEKFPAQLKALKISDVATYNRLSANPTTEKL